MKREKKYMMEVHGTPWGKRRVLRVSELEAIERFQKWRTVGARYNFDYPHSTQVCRLSLALFDELKKVHNMGARERALLMAAGLLHDVGAHRRSGKRSPSKPQSWPMSTSAHEHPHHHKRSQSLILEEGLQGLTVRENRIVACVARYHTKALPHKRHNHYGQMSRKDRYLVRRMSALLRIADSLDRRHASMVKDLRCKTSNKGKVLTIWVFCKKHAFDWRPKHRTNLFEKEFGMKVRTQVLFGTAVG